jgi:dihydropteroate synthase
MSLRFAATPPRPVTLFGGGSLRFEGTLVMGVVNVTPDSFSDGGQWLNPAAAIAHGEALVAAGADVLDIGGESTRPGSLPVSVEEQCARVLPVIEGLRSRLDVPISVDTTSATVAERALDAGGSLVNDISAFRFDAEMLPLLERTGAPAVAMHTYDAPVSMQESPQYDDVVQEVRAHLLERLHACEAAGVDPAQIILDPGFGFGKSLEHNLALLRHLPELVSVGRPVLVGTSRKRFLGEITGRDVEDRDSATLASCAVAISLGAHMIRVHDVAGGHDVARIVDAIAPGSNAR